MKLKNALVITARIMVIIGALYAGIIAAAAVIGGADETVLEEVYEATRPGIIIWIAAAFGVVVLYKFAEVRENDRRNEERD